MVPQKRLSRDPFRLVTKWTGRPGSGDLTPFFFTFPLSRSRLIALNRTHGQRFLPKMTLTSRLKSLSPQQG